MKFLEAYACKACGEFAIENGYDCGECRKSDWECWQAGVEAKL